MSQASIEITSNSRPSISALARSHGVHRRTVARRLKNGWEPAIKIVEQDQQGRTPAHPPAPVDLTALRHDIKEWARLHTEAGRLRACARDERRGRVSDAMSRFVCLGIGVGFFALIAIAAVG